MQPAGSHTAASGALRPAPRTAVRAAALGGLALIVAAITWRLRPSPPTTATAPDADIVLGCAWLAWALAGYLAVAVAATAFAHVVRAAGLAGGALTRLAPAGVRRLVDTAVTVSVTAAVLGASTGIAAPAVAATRQPPSSQIGGAGAPRPTAPGSALDWPGLTDPARPANHSPHPQPAPHSPAGAMPHRTGRHRPPHVGLVSGGRATPPAIPARGGDVVVQPGDSLWAIAADQLGRTASRAAITAAWHEWYAANRQVVGADPNLIYPGQRLRPPASR